MIRFLERFHRAKGIPNLMRCIVIGSVVVYLLNFLGFHVYDFLCLDPQAILHGQIWRIVSFVFLLPVGSILFAALTFYFYYLIGTALEQEWGSFIFTAYYLCNVLLTVAISLLTGTSVITAAPVNLALFLAFGYLFPDHTVLLFFIIPLKMKYLAGFYGVYAVWQALTVPTIGGKLMALVGVFTFLIFFGGEVWQRFFGAKGTVAARKKRPDHLRIIQHQCEVCKRTELDDPNLEFRYCSACDGYHEYCMEHLSNHIHVRKEDS